MEKLGLAFWFPKVGQDPFFFCWEPIRLYHVSSNACSSIQGNLAQVLLNGIFPGREAGLCTFDGQNPAPLDTYQYMSYAIRCVFIAPNGSPDFAQWTVANLGMNVPTSKTVVVFKFWVATCGHTKTRCIWQWRDPMRWGGDTGLGPWLEVGWLNWLLSFL